MDLTHERARVQRDGPTALEVARIAVSSDQVLVGETICAALRSRGLQVEFLPWWRDDDLVTESDADVELLACDLETEARVADAQARGRSCGSPWLVMTSSARGPSWGAMLDAGARTVVDSGISLVGLVEVLWTVVRGGSTIGRAEKARLVSQWRSARQRLDLLRSRMDSLSPREQEVLTMLYEGTTVRSIAEALGVSEATVRSQVKNLLRKLSVASQLAAVAAADELRENWTGDQTD